MKEAPQNIDLDEWDARYAQLKTAGLQEPTYGGPLRRHAEDGNPRLRALRFDNSAAALRLWNFLLTEEDRLHAAKRNGQKIIGTMKDLGTVPVMAYALPGVTAFYPDGAWWLPCLMELDTDLLNIADRLGVGEAFCPVRAMLGAFVNHAHFPIPDLLTCSVGATCDDFSAIAQRLTDLGHSILWWEIPHRRMPDEDELSTILPGGFNAPLSLVTHVRRELQRIQHALEETAGESLPPSRLQEGIAAANQVRRCLRNLRQVVYRAPICPLPALEMQIAEMLAIHFCSDRDESLAVLQELLQEAETRVKTGVGVLPESAARIFWVNPIADLRVMNVIEACGGRICGTDFLFCHALDEIPEELPPMEALARMALADPMAGSPADRADRICRDMAFFGAEGLVVSKIPGASHCATEGTIICDLVRERMKMPAIEIEVPPICDAALPSLRNRLEALVEIIQERRKLCSTRE